MRKFIPMLLMLALAAPAFAQDEEPKMKAEAQALFDDVKLVYTKYYEIILAKTKASERYNAAEVWETATAETKNAKYKDHAEFQAAVQKMSRDDRLFRREFNNLVTKLADDHAEAIRKWNAERDR